MATPATPFDGKRSITAPDRCSAERTHPESRRAHAKVNAEREGTGILVTRQIGRLIDVVRRRQQQMTAILNLYCIGWGGRIRTCEWRHQKPLPYHLATPQQSRRHTRRERALITARAILQSPEKA